MLVVGIFLFQNIVKFHDSYIKRKKYDYSKLPPHIVADILAQLNLIEFRNAVLTCRAWYYASCDPKVTKLLFIAPPYDVCDEDFLIRPVNNLRLSGSNISKLKYKLFFMKYGSSLRTVWIRCNKLPVTTVFELFIYLSNIEAFTIFSGSKDFSPSNYAACKKIYKHQDIIKRHLAKIKTLEINTGYKDQEAYKTFLSFCPNITTLHWNEYDLTTNGNKGFLYSYLLHPDENQTLRNYTDLLLHNIDRKENKEFFEKFIHLELRGLKKLSIREISKTYYDVMFKEFCKTYCFLESLYLSGCSEPQLTDVCLYIKNLKELELESCTANNLSRLGNLARLEYLKVERVDVVRDDDLIRLFDFPFKYLRKLWLNHVDENILKLLCENFTGLEVLSLAVVKTKKCEPIFRHLVKLKKMFISFAEPQTSHSSKFPYSSEWNITKLTQLEYLIVSCCVPGITPELVQQLPKLNTECIANISDPTDDEIQRDLESAVVNPVAQQAEHEQIVENEEYGISDFDFFNFMV